jgi:hypothetical protein
MTSIEVPDWVVEVACAKLAVGMEFEGKWPEDYQDDAGDELREAMKTAITAALGAWVVPQHQAQWIVEQCWEDITPEQFADLEETEAVTRTLYTLHQEKPE